MAKSPSHTFRFPSLIVASLAALAAPTLAVGQELRLKDGRVLVGKFTKKADQRVVETRDGTVVVAEADVVDERSEARLQEELALLAERSGDSAFAHLHLAIQARDYGLDKEMWRHIDKALQNLEQHTTEHGDNPVERRLRDFLAQLEPEFLPRSLRQAPTGKRILAMLRLLHAGTSPAEQVAIEELLVREPNADQHLRQEARNNANKRHRIGALAALQRRQLAGNDRFVLRTAIVDRNQDVRTAAIELARPTCDEDTVTYISGGLGHSNAKVRTRTAEALGNLGHPSAIPLLVKAGPVAAAGLAGGDGSSTRAHVAFLQQQAYIRDFNVEVAQAAFIADPQVDVLQSGTVLDVTVAGVYEVRTIVRFYRAALKQLTSFDPGEDPRTWAAWLDKLPAKPKAAVTSAR